MQETQSFRQGLSVGNIQVRVQPSKAKVGTTIFDLVNTSNLKETSSESSDSEYCYAVNAKQSKSPVTKLKVNNQKVTFTVDTGSTINIIDENTFKTLGDINLKKNKY